jgi:hypothetical protein
VDFYDTKYSSLKTFIDIGYQQYQSKFWRAQGMEFALINLRPVPLFLLPDHNRQRGSCAT